MMGETLTAAVLGIVGRLFRALPRRCLLGAGSGLGLLIYSLAGRRRRLALANIRAALGDFLPPGGEKALAKRSFAHLGMNLAEFFLLPLLTREKVASLVFLAGEEHLVSALARGKGVLLLSAHLGNWDLLAAALALRGHPLSLISKVSRSSAVNRVWMGYRESTGMKVFTGRNTMKAILSQLKSGGIVGFVLDQNALPGDGVFVPFFGRPACTLSSLAVLAARTGAPVVPAHIFREGDSHRAVIGPPLELPGMPPGEEGVAARTAAYTRWTEDVIRAHPEQWTWLHDRWKTRPPEGPSQRGDPSAESRRTRETGRPQEKEPADPATRRPAVFLDRDGTLIDEIGYLGDPEKLTLLPGAAEAVALLARAGYAVVVVTNQSGIARGYYPEEAAQAVNLRLLQELELRGARLDGIYFCPHLPEAGCRCRKPGTLMAERAAEDLGVELASSWIIGDMERDILLGRALGIKALLVMTGHAEKGPVPEGTPTYATVLTAARAIAGEGA